MDIVNAVPAASRAVPPASLAPLWEPLQALHRSAPSLASLLAEPQRFERFSARCGDLLLDLSRCRISDAALQLLLQWLERAEVGARRDAMFAGERINSSEQRAVMHVALRAGDDPCTVDGKRVNDDVEQTLLRLLGFAEDVRSGRLCAADGGAFTDVVNIGIGGSDLGPAMVCAALAPYHDGPRLHFVSNIDGAHLSDTLRALDPARTLFVVASKTFTTIETMRNAQAARRWLTATLGEAAVRAHFAAVSTAVERAVAFGIDATRVFGFWDWVGGRYSVWSAIGLPVMIAIGATHFRAFLDGARQMDRHFREAPAARNLPMLLAAAGLWHRSICGYPARAILPYDQRLARLPAYLQQLDMESNGKSVQRDGQPLHWATGPLVFGEPGTNGQHAFYQLLHQGSDIIPCEFLIAAQGHEPDLAEHHQLLVANCLAQSRALALGRDLDAAGGNPHRVFAGNRPSLTLAYRRLDPATLGALIALYEHRVFVEAAVWNINAFDQWGVELGKEMALALLPAVCGDAPGSELDPGTQGVLDHLRSLT
jgi:glucose-6-phosphate isomerase